MTSSNWFYSGELAVSPIKIPSRRTSISNSNQSYTLSLFGCLILWNCGQHHLVMLIATTIPTGFKTPKNGRLFTHESAVGPKDLCGRQGQTKSSII